MLSLNPRMLRKREPEYTDMMYRPDSFSESEPEDGYNLDALTPKDQPPPPVPGTRMLSSQGTAGTQASAVVDRVPMADPTPNATPGRMTPRGVTPNEEELLNQRVEIPQRPQRMKVDRGGVGGTIKHIGRGFLTGVQMGMSGRGDIGEAIGGGLGGGLVGAVTGGISPQRREDADYKYNRMPRYERESSAATEKVQKQEELASRIARRTGYDPVTGEETPETENRRMIREEARRRQDDSQAQRKSLDEDRDRKEKERVAAVAVDKARLYNQPVPEAAVKGTSLEHLAGRMAPPKSTPAPHFIPETGGRMIWDPEKGKVVPTPGADAIPAKPEKPAMTPYQSESLGMRRDEATQRRYDRSLARHTATLSHAGELMKRAQTAIDRARETDALEPGTGDWTAASAAVRQAVSRFPGILEGGEGGSGTDENKVAPPTGMKGYPYVDWKGGMPPNPEELADKEVPATSQSGITYDIAKQRAKTKLDQYLQRADVSEPLKKRARDSFTEYFPE